MLDGMASLFQLCKKLPKYLPKWLYHFTIPPVINEISYCSISLPAVDTVSVLDFSHSNKCAVMSMFIFYLGTDIII